MAATTARLIERTGVHPDTMQAIDALALAAVAYGHENAHAAEATSGDPLYPFKYTLALYLAQLERHVKVTKDGEPLSVNAVSQEAHEHIQRVMPEFFAIEEEEDADESDADQRPFLVLVPKGTLLH